MTPIDFAFAVLLFAGGLYAAYELGWLRGTEQMADALVPRPQDVDWAEPEDEA